MKLQDAIANVRSYEASAKNVMQRTDVVGFERETHCKNQWSKPSSYKRLSDYVNQEIFQPEMDRILDKCNEVCGIADDCVVYDTTDLSMTATCSSSCTLVNSRV